MANILVVDDEQGIRELLFDILNDEGHNVELAENASEARAARQRARPDLVLLDIWMPDTDGVTLLKEWSAAGLLTMPVIMMSGHATIDTAVEATRIGAFAFLEKPITMQKLLKAVEQGLARESARRAAASIVPSPLQHVAPLVTPSAEGLLTASASTALVSDGGTAAPASAAAPAAPAPVDSGPQARQLFDLDRPLRDVRDGFEKAYFEFHLAMENGSMTRVAEKTGLERTHLYRKLKQLGVDLSRGRRGAV